MTWPANRLPRAVEFLKVGPSLCDRDDRSGRAFDKGDIVRVRLEEGLSVVVLPTHHAPDPNDVPDELPEVFICCVPIALVRTPIEEGELRWVEVRDLKRADMEVETDDANRLATILNLANQTVKDQQDT